MPRTSNYVTADGAVHHNSGKSSGCVIELIKLASLQAGPRRRARFACIRNTYPQLKDTTMQTLFQWLPPSEYGTYYVSDHRYVIDKLEDGLEIEILFRALDREEHVSNLLSLELTAAWVNEAREVPWPIIQALTGRVGRYPSVVQGGCVRPCIIMDTNPPDDESWWYRKFEEERPSGWKLFKQPGGLDPNAENKSHLPAGYYERMVEAMDDDSAQVYVHGRYGFLKEGRPVYPEYVDSVHCLDKPFTPNPLVPVYRGWDFGLTPACAVSQLLPDGRWVTFGEFVADTVSFDSFAEAVLDGCATRWPSLAGAEWIDVGDPAGDQRSAAAMHSDAATCFDIARKRGIRMRAGNQSESLRLGSVRKALRTLVAGKPIAQVTPECKVLRRGYQGRYEYRKMRIAGAGDRYHDKPDKNEYSHIHDANQYVAVHLFGASVKAAQEALRRKREPIHYRPMTIV